jgi:hypothetical protein
MLLQMTSTPAATSQQQQQQQHTLGGQVSSLLLKLSWQQLQV